MLKTVFFLFCTWVWAMVTFGNVLPKTKDKPIAMMMAGLYPLIVLALDVFVLVMLKWAERMG